MEHEFSYEHERDKKTFRKTKEIGVLKDIARNVRMDIAIEATTGSLGHSLSVANGLTLSARSFQIGFLLWGFPSRTWTSGI